MGRIGGRKLWNLINSRPGGGIPVGRDRLFDLLEREHLKVHRKRRRVRTTYSSRWLRQWPNLIRGVVPTAANQIWVSDITYIDTDGGFAYLHLVTDAYSKKILGWCLSPTLHSDYTVEALRMAIRNAGCRLDGLIHHSDRGCQYYLSLGYATPAQASLMVGEQTRKWKNYYKTKESPEKTEEIILSLTSDVRTNLQTSGL